MSQNLEISHKERTLWRFVKKYINKKLYLFNNKINNSY